jgi:hypothetical protein
MNAETTYDHFTPYLGNSTSRPSHRRGGNAGAALFIALAFLSIFSLFGAAYVRFMSLELDNNARHLNATRAKQYAIAGIYNAIGQIEARKVHGLPLDQSATFTFGLYGHSYGSQDEVPSLLERYAAEADVSMRPVDNAAWAARFDNTPSWPGAGNAIQIISSSQIERAGIGQMRLLGKHSVEAIVAFSGDKYEIVSLGTCRE